MIRRIYVLNKEIDIKNIYTIIKNSIHELKQVFKVLFIYEMSVLTVEKIINEKGLLYHIDDKFPFIENVFHKYSSLTDEKSELRILFKTGQHILITFCYDRQQVLYESWNKVIQTNNNKNGNFYYIEKVFHSHTYKTKRINFSNIKDFNKFIEMVIYRTI